LKNSENVDNAIKEFGEVYDGKYKLKPGSTIEGPVVIEDYDTTIYVPEGWSGKADEYLNITLTRG